MAPPQTVPSTPWPSPQQFRSFGLGSGCRSRSVGRFGRSFPIGRGGARARSWHTSGGLARVFVRTGDGGGLGYIVSVRSVETPARRMEGRSGWCTRRGSMISQVHLDEIVTIRDFLLPDFIPLHPGQDKLLMAAGGSVEPFWAM